MYETIEHCGRIHVVKNGVESEWFTIAGYENYQLIYRPIFHTQVISREKALDLIASNMGIWYTAKEAVARLAELGYDNLLPATIVKLARDGALPGAMKIRGRGARGAGGAWRFSEAWVEAWVEAKRRKQQ